MKKNKNDSVVMCIFLPLLVIAWVVLNKPSLALVVAVIFIVTIFLILGLIDLFSGKPIEKEEAEFAHFEELMPILNPQPSNPRPKKESWFKKFLKNWREKSSIEQVSVTKIILKTFYFVLGFVLGLLISITDNILAGITILALWSVMYWPLYLALSKVFGLNAQFRTLWFTGVGENDIKFVVDQSNQLIKTLTPRGYYVNKASNENEIDGILVKGKNSMPTYFGGLYWVGIPPIRRIFTYNWEWTKIKDPNNIDPILREELVYGLRIRQQQYVTVRDLETKGLERGNYGFVITFHSIFPKKQLFKNDSPGNWLVKAKAEIESICRDYVASKDFTSLNSEAQYKDLESDSIYNKLIELSGHRFEDDQFVPKDSANDIHLVYTVGVAIIDVEIVLFESAENAAMKEIQLEEQKEVYLKKAEVVRQEKLDVQQDGENRRITSKSVAESTAKENIGKAETAVIREKYKAVAENNGHSMYISEQLKESELLSLGGDASMILNVDEHLKSKVEAKKPKKP